MINLMKSDFYKLLRSKGFYICTALSIAFALITLFRINNAYNVSLKNGAISDYTVYQAAVENGDPVYYVEKPTIAGILPISFTNEFVMSFILISISSFIASDFSSGVIKNIAIKVSKREYIFCSKFIISVFITFIVLVANFLTLLFGSLVLWGFNELPKNFYPELLRVCGLEFLAFIAITSVLTLISFIAEKPGKAIAANMCIWILSNTVLDLIFSIINKLFKSNFSVKDYWIFAYPLVLANYTLETDIIVRCSLVSIAYIAVITLLGVLLIRRKEIK